MEPAIRDPLESTSELRPRRVQPMAGLDVESISHEEALRELESISLDPTTPKYLVRSYSRSSDRQLRHHVAQRRPPSILIRRFQRLVRKLEADTNQAPTEASLPSSVSRRRFMKSLCQSHQNGVSPMTKLLNTQYQTLSSRRDHSHIQHSFDRENSTPLSIPKIEAESHFDVSDDSLLMSKPSVSLCTRAPSRQSLSRSSSNIRSESPSRTSSSSSLVEENAFDSLYGEVIESLSESKLSDTFEVFLDSGLKKNRTLSRPNMSGEGHFPIKSTHHHRRISTRDRTSLLSQDDSIEVGGRKLSIFEKQLQLHKHEYRARRRFSQPANCVEYLPQEVRQHVESVASRFSSKKLPLLKGKSVFDKRPWRTSSTAPTVVSLDFFEKSEMKPSRTKTVKKKSSSRRGSPS